MASIDEIRQRFAESHGLGPSGHKRLVQALTHRSVDGAGIGYERLEFLGDRVVGLIAADILLRSFPDEDEGAIARRHTALVRRETLAEIARDLELGPMIGMADSDIRSGGQENPAILSDIFEAVTAVLFLENGLEAARTLIEPHLLARIDREEAPPRDPKTALQETLQGKGKALPQYVVIDRTGPDHAPVFTVEVRVAGVPPSRAEGRSKRQAETLAAARMLESLEK